jgi:2-iminobutanoate/2-iminopropanoate deaminase
MRNATPVYLEQVPRPVGPYSPAVRAGDFVYVSGQVPRDPASGQLAGEDTISQAESVLGNLRRTLEAADASLEDVVSVTVYLVDPLEWGTFNEVYKRYFEEPFPSRTVIGAELRGIRVELSAVAYAPLGR